MATQTITIAERKSELEGEIARSQNSQKKAEGELAKLEVALDASAVEMGELRLRHVEHCRLHAKGETNDHAQVAADIGSTDATRIGLQSLVEEKRAEISRIRAQREPLEAELGQIYRQANIDAWVAEIQSSIAAGEAEVEQHLAITASHVKRLGDLRSYHDSAVRKMGLDAAEGLWRLWQGLQP